MIYKLYKAGILNDVDAAIKINDDGSTTSFFFDLNNTDYQQYLEWLAEGNTPEPADEPPTE